VSEHAIRAVVTVVLALTGLAILAALVSRGAQTSGVLGAGGSSLANAICVALSPVTGARCAETIRTSVDSNITFGGEVPISARGPYGGCLLGNC